MSETLSLCANEVRRYDWERFICTLFAPAGRREDLYTLLAFNSELARTREMVTEPLIGEMRLQWWREAIGGIYDGSRHEVSGHYVLKHLPGVIRRRELSKDLFDQLIEARLVDLSDQPPADIEVLLSYARNSSSALNLLQLEVLGHRDIFEDRAEDLGMAWALTGLMRAVPALGKRGRSPLPASLTPAERDLTVMDKDVCRAVEAVCTEARRRLEKAALQKSADKPEVRSLFLLGPLCRTYLNKFSRAGYDPSAPALQQSRAKLQVTLWIRALLGAY